LVIKFSFSQTIGRRNSSVNWLVDEFCWSTDWSTNLVDLLFGRKVFV
jgi:hypothetical protein